MAENQGGFIPPSADDNQSEEPPGNKQRVVKTQLEINTAELADQVDAKNAVSGNESGKVAKTLLETDAPSLDRIKELAEQANQSKSEHSSESNIHPGPENLSDSGRHSSNKTLLEPDVDIDSMTPEEFKAYRNKLARTIQDPRQEPLAEKTNSIKELAKTIPEPAKDKQNKAKTNSSKAGSNDSGTLAGSDNQPCKSESSSEQVASEEVSLKALAKTIPDPQMRERKAVAARIARIRSFQKTRQGKADVFSRNVGASSLDVLDTLREGSAGNAPADEKSNDTNLKGKKGDHSNSLVAPAKAVSPESASSPMPKVRPPVVREQLVAKTRLDHDILLQAVSESKVREEARVAAMMVEKAKEPPKPPLDQVKADKSASNCPFVWEETNSKDKYRYCSKCQTAIYNFDGMERPEAEALIFNRENRNKFTLYGRKDGKFMTVDCPVEARRRKNLMLSAVAGLALLVGAVAVMMLMPPPPPPAETPTVSSSDSAASDSATDGTTAVPTKDKDGMITFSSTSTRKPSSQRKTGTGTGSAGGGDVQRFKLPSVNDRSAQAPDPDEDGRFWKFE
ncbi:MAG TPA: hypothetical protein V6C89_02740 [Drouetiella sp.]|jgi:hypothetical protein